MSIVVPQNQQNGVQVHSQTEKACKDQIVRWLDELDEFSPDQLQKTAHGLSELSLKQLQAHTENFAQNRIAESKDLCLQKQRDVSFDRRLLFKSFGKGAGAIGGGTGCSLAAMSSAGIMAMGAIGTGGVLCVFFLGSDCYRTFCEAHPKAKRKALEHSAEAYNYRITHLTKRIHWGLDHRIEVARIQNDLDVEKGISLALQFALDQANKASEELRTKLEAADQVTVGLRSDLEASNQVTAGLRSDFEASNQVAVRLRSDLEASNQVAVRLRSDLEASNQVTAGLRSDLEASNQVTAGLRSDLEASNQVTAELRSDLEASNQVTAELRTALDTANVATVTLRSDLDAANEATSSLRSDLEASRNESRDSQQRLENKVEALITAMNGNSTSRSVSDLMQSRMSQSPQIQLAEENEAANAFQQNDQQDEDFIHVFNTTDRAPSDDRAAISGELSLSPQDAASNYHLARADQQIANFSERH